MDGGWPGWSGLVIQKVNGQVLCPRKPFSSVLRDWLGSWLRSREVPRGGRLYRGGVNFQCKVSFGVYGI